MTTPHLHIIGICGTAMAGLAALAQQGGWRVTGSDASVYPPMSTFLAERGIPVADGFRAENLHPRPDLVLVGNAISRGNAELEAVLDQGLPYRSGAEWFHHHVLEGRHPIVVTGTHGKTTTASLAAWVWEYAGLRPGFLIGGIPRNFGEGARFPQSPWVVVEGDEYDTAFFDKGAKFLHYHPRTLILHNLEYDHADIYPDLEAIRRQFRLLLRLVPASGTLLAHGDDPEIVALARNAFTPVTWYGLSGEHAFTARLEQEDGRCWTLIREGQELCTVTWQLTGRHNVVNGLAVAVAALLHGIAPETIAQAFAAFSGVARRLEVRDQVAGITLYDDFAHHPTAIATTLAGLKAVIGAARLWGVLEPRSNTMRRRIHQERLAPALSAADYVLLARPAPRGLAAGDLLDVDAVANQLRQMGKTAIVIDEASQGIAILRERLTSGDHVVVMSNGGFDGIHERLARALMERG